MVVMATGKFRNWVWRTDHPLYGPSVVHETTDTVIGYTITPHKRGYAKLYNEGSTEVEDEIDFGTNMLSDWMGAAAWLAARQLGPGAGEIDHLLAAVRELRAAFFELELA
jgi:hypothetical protein